MSQETILVVDDSPKFSQTLIEYMLIPLNYKVLLATNGRRGLKMATENEPDLIMLDMNMPQMDGLAMLAALRKTKCESPVIFMTAEGSESVAVEAFRLGVRDYLAKPFTIEALQQALDKALNEIRLAREKKTLTRNLVAAETVRQTVVTLSHYINNYLMVLTGNLAILEEEIPSELVDAATILQAIKDCQTSTNKIAAVLRVLQQVTNVELATYHGDIKMVDIEAALRRELKKLRK